MECGAVRESVREFPDGGRDDSNNEGRELDGGREVDSGWKHRL